MITPAQYFKAKPHTPEHEAAAIDLLDRRNRLRAEWSKSTGQEAPRCPNTGTEVSGSKGGQGDGGFRLESATTGKVLSSHKQAKGVDDFDPKGDFDNWLDRFEQPGGKNTKLEEYGLYREDPRYTEGWTHLTTRPPPTGHRTFIP